MHEVIMTTSNDEQINRDFVRNTTPTEPPAGAFRFDYRGYWNCESHCTLEIHGNVVIATEADDNEGTSITNMAEHLATRVCHQFQIDPLKLVWIEHYPERGHEWRSTPIPESWDFVTFKQIAESNDGAPRCMKPSWNRIGQEQVQELIEQRGEYQELKNPFDERLPPNTLQIGVNQDGITVGSPRHEAMDAAIEQRYDCAVGSYT